MECMEWDASLVASYRPRETWRQAQQRLSATVQQPGWEIGGLRIAIEAFSGLFCANRHQSPVCTVQEVRVGRDSVAILPVESLPLRSARVIRSGVEPRSRLGEMDPSTPGVVPVPVARQARSSRRQTQPPPVGGHHSHIPVDSGNRLGLVLLDFASSQLSTRFASELPRCPETCRSRQATRQTVPGRRVCDSSPGLESIILPPPVPRPLPQANLSISEPANLSRGEPPDFPD